MRRAIVVFAGMATVVCGGAAIYCACNGNAGFAAVDVLLVAMNVQIIARYVR